MTHLSKLLHLCHTCDAPLFRLIDLSQSCENPNALNMTNSSALEGCHCTSAEERFDNGEISCNDICPDSCDVCDVCFKLRCEIATP